MRLLTLENWPVLVICAGMLAAAIIDWWKFKVPNKLTFPLILSGWLLGLANDLGLGAGEGGIGAALVGTFLGFLLLLPIYSVGGMGAGDVKMTMGFGAWIGAFYGTQETATHPGGLWIIVYAFCAGTIVGGVIALGMIVARGRYRDNVQHVREILGDLFKLSNLTQASSKANARRPRWHRLPYGVPLCIGFLGYLIFAHGL
jgi:prepilin peptidase CpaA